MKWGFRKITIPLSKIWRHLTVCIKEPSPPFEEIFHFLGYFVIFSKTVRPAVEHNKAFSSVNTNKV